MVVSFRRSGSIPASAGEPRSCSGGKREPGVHPRERGGAEAVCSSMVRASGPSPRARGSPGRGGRRAPVGGSIPASAGEPRTGLSLEEAQRVHPRERGGAGRTVGMSLDEMGPSPRARGSRCLSLARRTRPGSIPASAGEPWSPPGSASPSGVHPRERGGALGAGGARTGVQGPSPRARGSLRWHGRTRRGHGSIPASAGEPSSRRTAPRASRVHPRERGGALYLTPAWHDAVGPSPRARGSQRRAQEQADRLGSIPASAGEPHTTVSPITRLRVHPRERGGAAWAVTAARDGEGPSPRARGSPARASIFFATVGSIPASAGEPQHGARSPRCAGVHPRERGGASAASSAASSGGGPSPRARGSPARHRAGVEAIGSIPASAGEPWRSGARSISRRVHPRERGGAQQR